MTTSISSKAFCSITDRQTDKIFTEQMLIYERNLHKKNWCHISITFPRTDRRTDIRTDIYFYRVALLLKRSYTYSVIYQSIRKNRLGIFHLINIFFCQFNSYLKTRLASIFSFRYKLISRFDLSCWNFHDKSGKNNLM